MNTGKLYIFTEGGKCHQIKVLSVPMGRYNDKGVPLEQVSAMGNSEVAVSVISDYRSKEKLLFATRKGLVKRVALSEFDTTRKTIEATKLAADDALVTVTCISDSKTVLLVSKNQLCVAFEISGISLLKKTAAGVIGIKLVDDDEVVYADMVTDVSEFVLNDKIYRVSSIAPGKRGTRGRPL